MQRSLVQTDYQRQTQIKLFDVDESDKGSEAYEARISKPVTFVDLKIELVDLCSILNGKVSPPRLVAIRFKELNSLKVLIVHLNPVDFLPTVADQSGIEKSLLYNGFDEDGTQVRIRKGSETNIYIEQTENVFNVLPALVAILREIQTLVGDKLILKFSDIQSKEFFFGLFANPSLSIHRPSFLDSVEEIEFGNENELMTEELLDQLISEEPYEGCIDTDAILSYVYVDLNFATFKDAPGGKSFTQITELAVLSETKEENQELAVSLRILIENAQLLDETAQEMLEKFSQHDSAMCENMIDEKFALLTMCRTAEKTCACSKGPSSRCNLVLATFSHEKVYPALLSKIFQHELEAPFFRHFIYHTDLQGLARYMCWPHEENIFAILESASGEILTTENISCLDNCVLMQHIFDLSSDRLPKILQSCRLLL